MFIISLFVVVYVVLYCYVRRRYIDILWYFQYSYREMSEGY